MRRSALLIAALALPLSLGLSACGKSDKPGEVTAAEDAQLNADAAMLDDNQVSINETDQDK